MTNVFHNRPAPPPRPKSPAEKVGNTVAGCALVLVILFINLCLLGAAVAVVKLVWRNV